MTLEKIFNMGLINDNTEIFIRADVHVIAHGNWYQDHMLDHTEDEAESFSWQDDNKVYIDIK